MIEKMNFVNIAGPRENIDDIVEKYLSKYEIHLEYAPSELKSVNTLYPYTDANPYKEYASCAEELADAMGREEKESVTMGIDESVAFIRKLYKSYKEIEENIRKYETELLELRDKLVKVEPFSNVNYDIDEILDFKNICFRFGRIPKDNFVKFTDYVNEDIKSVFVKAMENEKYVYGIYFAALRDKESVDAAYTSLHFERTFIASDVHGTPDEAISDYKVRISELEKALDGENLLLNKELDKNRDKFYEAYASLNRSIRNFDIRKYAACTKEDGLAYFIICGWMAAGDALKMSREIEKNEKDTMCIVDGKNESTESTPPTKLKNPKLVKPFEMFIKMYGMPAYNEIDPTIFVAITYAFIFGAMFGDVGQGLCLLIGGFVLYKVKHMDLAAIIASAGFFSTIFGFLYGSLFGFEDILHHLWLSPSKAMSNLPFVGRLNTVFVVAVAFGMGIIVIAMIMHIINAFRARDTEGKWFDANGVAGLVFYAAIVMTVVLFMTGNTLPAGAVLIVMFVVPLILIALKEPITHKLQKKKAIDGGVGMFATQTFFEMFEVLLSYFSNTLSFIRVGAFAVSHAAMMEVVLMLAGAENGSTGNIIVIIIGNIIVCGLEGLIVGIQVLRLEYYEIFSRFYKGTGREFKPYGKTAEGQRQS